MRQIDRQLFQSCNARDYRKIPGILDAGADPNAVDEEDWWSPLSALVYNSIFLRDETIPVDFWQTIELLLQKGADINLIIRSPEGCISTALLESRFAAPEIIQFLLEHGADPDVVNEEEQTILDAVELDQFAYEEDMWKDDSDYWGGYSRIRKILLDHGAHRASTLEKMAESEKWDEVKRKIYHACWHLEAGEMDRLLAENPILLPDKRFDGLFREAVQTAAEFMQKHFIDDQEGYEDRLIALLDVFRKHGLDLNADEGDALYYSVMCGYVKTARYLPAHGADPAKCACGYSCDAGDDSPEHRHYFTLPERVLHWRCYWKKETALAFQEMFPLEKQ